MTVGIVQLELYLPLPNSLKTKRVIIKRIIDSVRHSFNVSISEVDYHDLWQRALVAVAAVGNDKQHLNRMLDKIVNKVDAMGEVEIIQKQIEFI